MTDIVKRLKAVPSGMVKAMYPPIPVPHELAWEAADEIERLREALRKIANGYSDEDGMRNIARQALGEKE